MLKKKKPTTKLSREAVVPFHQEELLVVPKKGGFGQPDNEKYVMVAGGTTLGGTTNAPAPSPSTTTQIGTDVGTTTSTSSPTQVGTSTTTTVTGASTPSTSTASTQQSGQVTTPLANLPTTTTTTTTPPVVTGVGSDTTTPSQEQLTCEANGGIWSNNACVTSPKTTTASVTLPTFPDFTTLDCAGLTTWKDNINSTLAQGRFVAEVANAYNNALTQVTTLYASKCYQQIPPIVVLPDVGSGGGGGIGGGGGGLGDEPTAEVSEPTKSNSGLWLIGAIIVGVYFLTKKKN